MKRRLFREGGKTVINLYDGEVVRGRLEIGDDYVIINNILYAPSRDRTKGDFSGVIYQSLINGEKCLIVEGAA